MKIRGHIVQNRVRQFRQQFRFGNPFPLVFHGVFLFLKFHYKTGKQCAFLHAIYL
jgi:hypothetical protein